MVRILGIDPGSCVTGYAVLEETRQGPHYLASGVIRVQGESFPARLKQIFDGVSQIVQHYQPQQFAIEQVFMHKNADSALKLGQARGAAICAAQAKGLDVFEYSARQVKQALTGRGNADKVQVRHMAQILLGLNGAMPLDAGDALGVCLCHLHYQQTQRHWVRMRA